MHVSASDIVSLAETNLNELPETTAIVIASSLGITNRLQPEV